MGYKTIMALVGASRSSEASLRVAAELADRFDAHLIGVHVRRPFETPMYSDTTAGLDLLYRSYDEASRGATQAAAAAFKNAVGGRSASEWRLADGFAEEILVAQARFADLVVMGQSEPDPSPFAPVRDLAEKFVFGSERPLLIVPHAGEAKPVGEKVMLCWNGRREASRAATAALPLLRKAKSVTVLIVDPEEAEQGASGEPGADVAGWLARHGVNVTVQRDTAADSDVGNVILSRAADLDIDLVVMGLYGHSRMRELILGGASRTILSSMTVPILVSH